MTHSAPSRLLALRAQWYAFAALLLACARRISLRQRAGSHEAWGQADLLEVWVRTALSQLTWQLRAIDACGTPLSPEEEDALRHLKSIAYGLLMLALFLQYLKGKCVRGRAGMRVGALGETAGVAAPPRLADPPGYLDSS